MIEAGVPNLEVRDWQGILAPRGTPKAVVDKLAGEMIRVLQQPDTRARYAVAGMDIIASTPQQFGEAIASEIKRWAKVVKAAGIQAQ
jgi:tripartite-type tricarboxylate transporter receptor subunit TctC